MRLFRCEEMAPWPYSTTRPAPLLAGGPGLRAQEMPRSAGRLFFRGALAPRSPHRGGLAVPLGLPLHRYATAGVKVSTWPGRPSVGTRPHHRSNPLGLILKC